MMHHRLAPRIPKLVKMSALSQLDILSHPCPLCYRPRNTSHNSEGTVVDDLVSAAQAVADERAFIRLLQMMALDRQDEQQKELASPSPPYSAGANGWENGSIEAFLDAAAAWAEATSRTTHLGAGPSDAWRRAAMIVVAGAFYE
jgi:hypothetical protein